MAINIAIDGPSSAGKSTISKMVAQELGYRYLDTGAMYRCVALKSKLNNIVSDNEEALVKMLKDTCIEFDAERNIYMDKVDVTKEIRENEISFIASTISLLKGVRNELVKRQQSIAKENPGIVMDGRDIGSVVLKDDAQLKIFLTANSDVRAKRRFHELLNQGKPVIYKEIFESIKKRDSQDATRTNSPLIKVEDAIEIDTSHMTIVEVVDKIVVLAKEMGA